MIENMTQARLETFGLMIAELGVDPDPILSSDLVVIYEGRELPGMGEKDPTKSYLELFMRPASGVQASLANEGGQRRWEDVGTLWIRCWGSNSTQQGLEIAEALATIATKVYRGKSTENCIWFRDLRKNTVGAEDGWYRIDVLTTYEYDEIG